MQHSKVAKRYARALFQVGLEENLLENFYADMQSLKAVLEESKELQSLFKSPIIKSKRKIALIKELFENKIHQTVINFLAIITNAKRESITYAITQQFDILYKEHKGIKSANITTVSKLDDDMKNQLLAKLQDYTKAKIELSETIDENLIGGMILSVDDKQFANSIRTNINKMRKELTE